MRRENQCLPPPGSRVGWQGFYPARKSSVLIFTTSVPSGIAPTRSKRNEVLKTGSLEARDLGTCFPLLGMLSERRKASVYRLPSLPPGGPGAASWAQGLRGLAEEGGADRIRIRQIALLM